MSKQDNLTDFLTDVADAIREKKGTTEKINPQNFSDEIKGIETGSGIVPCEFKDVNFYDYEGTILYSYTWDEFVAKNEMPPLPTHREKEGLICQEWNYTLEEVLEQGGRCDVGAIYTTLDGYSHLHTLIHNTNTRIAFSLSEYNTVDWGDGIVDTVKGTASHTYSQAGAYDIVIKGNGQIQVAKATYDRIHICHPHTLKVNRGKMNRISIDARVTDLKIDQAFGLEHLTLNRNIKNIGAYQVYSISQFKSISLTNDTTLYAIGSNSSSLNHIPSKAKIALTPNTSYRDNISLSVKNPYYEKVNGCIIDLDKKEVLFMESGATIPDGVLSIARQIPYATFRKIIMPDSVNSVARSCFQDITYEFMLVSKNLMYIPSSAFAYGVGHMLFVNNESVPVIEDSHVFAGIYKKIVVPDALYDEWIAATNWSAYADRIVKASEYVEPTNE